MSTQSLNRRALTVLVSLVFVCISGCKKDSTEPSGPVGPGTVGQYKIAFSSYRQGASGNFEIYVVNSDGTNLTRLTSDTTISNLYPEWSPDGRKIVYVQHSSSGYAIYAMNSDGTNQIRLSTNAGDDWDERPIWSPDGGKIIFTGSLGPGMAGIYLMGSDGTNQHLLASGGSPAWSRDGTKIAHTAGGWPELFTINTDGTNQQQITHDSAYTRYPSWSPDGAKIAFLSQRDGNNELYTINADGTNLLRLTNDAANDIFPYWSPDGARILFVSNRDGHNQVYRMNSDGTNQTRLTNDTISNYWPEGYPPPQWSPDGTKIVYVHGYFMNDMGIYVMNSDGMNQQRLATGLVLWPTWSPVRVP
jgi:Tol biopolymer transport system component